MPDDPNPPSRSPDAPARSPEDLQFAVDAARLGTFYCDWPLDKIVWNAACKAHFFLPPDAEVDFDLFYSILHPDDREPTRQAIDRAMRDRVEYNIEYRTVAPDGRTRWVNAVGRFYYGEDGRPVRFDGVTIDISARKRAEDDLRRRAERDQFLADLAARAQGMDDPQEVIADAVRSLGVFLDVSRCLFADVDLPADSCTIPLDYCAPGVASMAGTFPLSTFGAFLLSEYAAGRTVVIDDVQAADGPVPVETLAAYDAVGVGAFIAAPVLHSARLVSVIAVHSPVPRRWRADEADLVQTVVERTWLTVEVLRQRRALEREAEERREAHRRTAAILASITDAFVALDRDWRFTHLNDQAERLISQTREAVMGRSFWEVLPDAIGSTFERMYRQAVRTEAAVAFEEFFPPLDAWFEVRAYPSPEGLSIFFQNIQARKRAEAERDRLLSDLRARAEREALLNRIGKALRSLPDPAAILETAVRELGPAAGADRCYYVTYDQDADTAIVGPDWVRGGLGLPSLTGRYRMSPYAVNRDPVYKAGRTQVMPDTSGDPATHALGLRALIRVPLVSGRAMTSLSVAMADGPRAWTPEEVALVEAVATQTQTALEAVRVQRREHAIAQQLQDALQPALPESVPGLSLGHFTQPALEEAQVGGDFLDVFPLDSGRYALVIGDVSGKGLAAAQQLALIRNSLRTTLYLSRAPAPAAAALNRIVTAHDLLVGFVTCWVGVYEPDTGRIVYCSCGHEPGLLRRTGGGVETLETTGPPLGVSEGAAYEDAVVRLASGDRLLLSTDGLSEAGPSRRALLGTDGLARLLGALPPDEGAQAQVEALVEQAAAFAGGVFRDDVAALLLRRA